MIRVLIGLAVLSYASIRWQSGHQLGSRCEVYPLWGAGTPAEISA